MTEFEVCQNRFYSHKVSNGTNVLLQTVYNVELTCQSCVDSVKNALSTVRGVSEFDIDLAAQRVSVIGSTPPSQIIKSIQDTGRDAIIRGTGKPNSAAVAILENFNLQTGDLKTVNGLARIVAVNDSNLLVDLTIDGLLKKGLYYPSIRRSGDISQGALSTGESILDLPAINVSEKEGITYSGQLFTLIDLKIHDLIGRSFAISNEEKAVNKDSLVGVIARSAGAWENDKQVCSCSGKTIWQERTDAHQHGLKI